MKPFTLHTVLIISLDFWASGMQAKSMLGTLGIESFYDDDLINLCGDIVVYDP